MFTLSSLKISILYHMEGNLGVEKIWRIHRKIHLAEENMVIILPLDKNTLWLYSLANFTVHHIVWKELVVCGQSVLAQNVITCSISAQ